MKYSLFFAVAIVLSCNSGREKEDKTSANATLPDGFSVFYQNFHSDSTFQMQHIIFPLQGIPDHADSLSIANDNYHWLPEDWSIQRTIDFEMSEFIRQFEVVNEQMVVERIIHKNGEYGMIRRFAKVAGEWHLIYYAGLNRLAS